MPQRGLNKSRKIAVQDSVQVLWIRGPRAKKAIYRTSERSSVQVNLSSQLQVQGSVQVNLLWNWNETRKQMGKCCLSKKSFTYEIYARTSKPAHKVFQERCASSIS